MTYLNELWSHWRDLTQLLERKAQGSRLSQVEQEQAIQDTLLGLAQALASKTPPQNLFAYADVSMQRTLGDLRRRTGFQEDLDWDSVVDPADESPPPLLSVSHPTFWAWGDAYKSRLKSFLTHLEWLSVAGTILAGALERPIRLIDYAKM